MRNAWKKELDKGKAPGISKQAIEAETSVNTTLRANGTGCRAKALPKVLTPFEGAHLFRKVSILENPDDSFEDAHPFPRCSPDLAKNLTRALERRRNSVSEGAGAKRAACAKFR